MNKTMDNRDSEKKSASRKDEDFKIPELKYVEPESYFTKEMLEILEKGEKKEE